MGRIGLGIITYKRAPYFQQCLEAVKKNDRDLDELVVVHAGGKGYDFQGVEVIENQDRTWVAVNKNLALKHLMDKGCDHLFLIEDDILIQTPDVFQNYIKAAEARGLHHLNFAHHGPANEGGSHYSDGVIDIFPHGVGAFSYFTRFSIDQAGYFDENFINASEHLEHTKRIGDMGLTTPFWAFADATGSDKWLTEIPGSIDKSSIRPNKDWEENIKKSIDYWRGKDDTCPL